MSAPRRQPRPLSRREFLRRAGTLSAVTAAATVWTPQLREARARTNGTVVAPQGTTLEGFIWFQDTGGELITPDGYTRLTHYEPGGPIEVRTVRRTGSDLLSVGCTVSTSPAGGASV